jgi:hypothetical protein
MIRRINVFSILNYINYNKKDAIRVLEEELNWRPYGGKHYESIYTRFFQGYILPTKFQIDKRKGHLSALVMTGQMSRQEALSEMATPPYSGYMYEEDLEYILKKFNLKAEEFGQIMALPKKTYRDYPNYAQFDEFIRDLWIVKAARKAGFLTD